MQSMGEAPLGPPAADQAAASPQPAAGNPDALQRASVQARQLVERHLQQPHELSEALAELKARYLAEQFHINPNAVEK
jgi:hypothetical protein